MAVSWLVVKVGGEVAADPRALGVLARDLADFGTGDGRACVVHGGGPQATELSRRLGIEPRVVAGRRITDADTLEVMKMVLAGPVSLSLVTAFTAAAMRPLGLAGASGGLVCARKRPPVRVTGAGDELFDMGHVGDVVSINTDLLDLLAGAGYLPVISSLGADAQGTIYNINADIVAGAVAAALGAAHLFHITGAQGVLADPDDPASRIPILHAAQARAAIAAGTIRGGMIPKIEESLAVLDRGVGAVHIIGAGVEGALVAEVEQPGSVGTVLLA